LPAQMKSAMMVEAMTVCSRGSRRLLSLCCLDFDL
jgi:hypothetical protein